MNASNLWKYYSKYLSNLKVADFVYMQGKLPHQHIQGEQVPQLTKGRVHATYKTRCNEYRLDQFLIFGDLIARVVKSREMCTNQTGKKSSSMFCCWQARPYCSTHCKTFLFIISLFSLVTSSVRMHMYNCILFYKLVWYCMIFCILLG